MSNSETGMDDAVPQASGQAFERATSSNVVIKNTSHSAKMAGRNKLAMNLSWWASEYFKLACCSHILVLLEHTCPRSMLAWLQGSEYPVVYCKGCRLCPEQIFLSSGLGCGLLCRSELSGANLALLFLTFGASM